MIIIILSTDSTAIGVIVPIVIIALFIAYSIRKSVTIVKEKEVMVIERLGNFHSVLTAGFHLIVPFFDAPKKYSYRYFITNGLGKTEIVEKKNLFRISTQNEVLDFPKQNVITRDNASVYLDAVSTYSCNNLPHVLSKLLQAQIRNVAGSLDIDQIIEESASLNVLTGLVDNEASRWGVKILFVKIQRVEAMELSDVLAKKKNADLQNKEVIITAKAKKQTRVIESEGERDSMIKKAEGEALELMSKARGESQAIINSANAEARAIKELARAVGKDVTKYLLSMKYIEGLKDIAQSANTHIQFLPNKTAYIQTAREFGINTVLNHPSLKVASQVL